jgi:glutamine synthetase
METLKRVAGKHGLRCMLHEKPFAGVNGSGKHNNWSITTDNGVNLLEPGQTPNENIQFLLVLACIMKAVDTHADLLRQSASNVGNDHRLGGYEAPPAIISIFLGEQLEDVVAQLVETGKADNLKEGGVLRTGVSTLPDFVKDATDRNRTSPFAFTGNKIVLVGSVIQEQITKGRNQPFAAALSAVLMVLTSVMIRLYRKITGTTQLEGML